MVTFIVQITIFLICLLTVSAVIFTDVYGIAKLKNKEQVDIDMVKFYKCILPYKSNL